MKEVSEDFKAVDLHVHTPASLCYKGDKTEDEYLDILRRYINKQVKVIAITDHNTIKGYRQLMKIKEELIQKTKTIKDLVSKYPDLQNEINDLNDKLLLFNNIFVLPGVEFEANPGIHLLFIFNPKQNLNDIDRFLESCGYSDSNQGLEVVTNVNVDVLDALRKAKELNAITIGAHIDSDKGIYNDLKGTFRSRVFTSDDLDGISINSVTQIEKIRSLLKDPQYKRNSPLAIIQSSDHHEKCDCAKHIAFFKIKYFDFDEVVSCFKNPNESISSTERPEIVNIIKKIADDDNTICIECLEDEKITKASCAVLNSGFGNVLVGVTSDKYKNIKGVIIDDELIKQLKDSIIKNLNPEKLFYTLSCEKYSFGQRYVVQLKFVNISNKQFYYNSNYYSLLNETIIENNIDLLSSSKVNKIKKGFDEFHNAIDSQLYSIKNELELLMVSKNNFDLLNRLNENGIKLSRIINIDLVYPINNCFLKKTLPHGVSEGNVYYCEKIVPRYPDIYLRCSCPITNEIEFSDKKTFKDDALIIVPNGAIFLINSKTNWNLINLEKYEPILVCKIRKEFREFINLQTLIGWLKSSLSLWYMYNQFSSYDIHNPFVFNNLYIPTEIFHNNIDIQINDRILNILEMEKIFLKEGEIFLKDVETVKEKKKIIIEEYTKKADIHNKQVDKYALEIDELLFNCFNLTSIELNMVGTFLKHKQLYNFQKASS